LGLRVSQQLANAPDKCAHHDREHAHGKEGYVEVAERLQRYRLRFKVNAGKNPQANTQ